MSAGTVAPFKWHGRYEMTVGPAALDDARYFTATAFALQERPQFYDRDVEPADMVQLVASLRQELEAERLRRVRAERRLRDLRVSIRKAVYLAQD